MEELTYTGDNGGEYIDIPDLEAVIWEELGIKEEMRAKEKAEDDRKFNEGIEKLKEIFKGSKHEAFIIDKSRKEIDENESQSD